MLDSFAVELRRLSDGIDVEWRSAVLNPLFVRAFRLIPDDDAQEIGKRVAIVMRKDRLQVSDWETFYMELDVISKTYNDTWLSVRPHSCSPNHVHSSNASYVEGGTSAKHSDQVSGMGNFTYSRQFSFNSPVVAAPQTKGQRRPQKSTQETAPPPNQADEGSVGPGNGKGTGQTTITPDNNPPSSPHPSIEVQGDESFSYISSIRWFIYGVLSSCSQTRTGTAEKAAPANFHIHHSTAASKQETVG